MPVLDVKTERVLVVPTAAFRDLGYFQGFSHETQRYLDGLLRSEHMSYRPRGEMEQDPEYKQLIPYVIFRHRDQAGTAHLFQYTRGKGQGEGRLHHKRSIGVGGHISSDDVAAGGDHPYEEGMRRELAEEVHIGSPYRSQCLGLINDDETDVGRVHLGVVHLFDVERPLVEPREAEMVESGFRPFEALLTEPERFETWSQICLRALAEIDA
ncbi:MAG TPA: phosphoesterase [Pirellulales bacterium]|jgi:predicted NUDIX family phosphoesterase|nr:phosphoesterase [Pirellulales bacterium]